MSSSIISKISSSFVGGDALLSATSNTSWVIAGNNSVSNVAVNDEIVVGGSIKNIWFNVPSGNSAYWEIKRGANIVFILSSSGELDLTQSGSSFGLYQSANLTVTLYNSVNATIMLGLKKNTIVPFKQNIDTGNTAPPANTTYSLQFNNINNSMYIPIFA